MAISRCVLLNTFTHRVGDRHRVLLYFMPQKTVSVPIMESSFSDYACVNPLYPFWFPAPSAVYVQALVQRYGIKHVRRQGISAWECLFAFWYFPMGTLYNKTWILMHSSIVF